MGDPIAFVEYLDVLVTLVDAIAWPIAFALVGFRALDSCDPKLKRQPGIGTIKQP